MTPISNEVSYNDFIDSIRRMALLAEHYDKDLVQHRERVRRYCRILGHALGLGTDEADLLGYASLLHDIGKVMLPVEIAAKAGNLTPYEWDIMKRHTIVGSELLKGSPSPVIQAGEVIALTHHERWDGSGYPRGLKGNEIPMSGRICAIADVFDALITRKSYKSALPVEQAIEMIISSSGQLFDPMLVEMFSDRCDDILRARTSGTSRLSIER
jgi:putative two-component system response regulator